MCRLLVFALTLAVGHLPYAISPSFAKETGEDRPVGSLGGAVHADPFTGVATTSIPIEVPPGRNGMQPSLALTYNSAAGNGWLGIVWTLELGTIERQTKWGVLYTPTTAEEQAGKVYTIRVNGISADLVPAPPPAPSDEYRAKIEGGFLRIKKLSGGTAGWEVTDKTGKKYLFGTSTATRMADPADATKIFKWCLEKIVDRDGNYLTATYFPDNNQSYLDQRGGAGNSDRSIRDSLAQPKPWSARPTEEHAHEKDAKESRTWIQGQGGLGRDQGG